MFHFLFFRSMAGRCNQQRREFLLDAAASLGVILSSSTLASVLASCESDTTKPSATTGQKVEFNVSTEPALANVGGVVKKTFGSNNGGMPVFIVRTGETMFVVLSSRCTHQGCEVDVPQQPGGKLVCPCHLAEYDPQTGTQTKPPSGSGPTGSLQRFDAQFDPQTNILTITF
jgi:Rieske Fe-S protein